MMTTTDRLAAMIEIARDIDRDIANRPNFTMTCSQLRARIDDFILDNPNNSPFDCAAIFNAMLTDPDLPLRD